MAFPFGYRGTIVIQRYYSIEDFLERLADTLYKWGARKVQVHHDVVTFQDSEHMFQPPWSAPLWGITSAQIRASAPDGVLIVSYRLEFLLIDTLAACGLCIFLLVLLILPAWTQMRVLQASTVFLVGVLLYAIQVVPSILRIRKAIRKYHR